MPLNNHFPPKNNLQFELFALLDHNSMTTFSYPPRQVKQQLQPSSNMQGNQIITSYMSHNDWKSFTWPQIRLRSLETAPDTSCPPSPSRGLSWRQNNSPCIFPHDCATPAADFKPPCDSQTFCYALPAIYTRHLAPAHTPTSWSRHLHVIHTRHTYVIPCPNHHTQRDICSATPCSCICVIINILPLAISYM